MKRREFLSTTLALTVGSSLEPNMLAKSFKPLSGEQYVPKVGAMLPDFEASMPFSFVYDGQASHEVLARWPRTTHVESLDAERRRRTYLWKDLKTALEVRCVVVDYANSPAVEWTVYFRNAGTDRTPILETCWGWTSASIVERTENSSLMASKGIGPRRKATSLINTGFLQAA